jgi:hypothetical protein
MAITYDPIATTTLGGNQTTVTFSGISQAYTDLHIVAVYRTTSANVLRMRYNGDSSTEYSCNYLSGINSTVTSRNQSSLSYNDFSYELTSNFYFTISRIDINGYSDADALGGKNIVIETANDQVNASGSSCEIVAGQWQYFDGTKYPAISSIQFGCVNPSIQIATGSTFTLYGILRA